MRVELPSGTVGELVVPERAVPGRGVVLAPDIMGLRPLFDELCARLASERGWVVCAAEPFPGREQLTVEERMEAMRDLDDERQLAHLLAAADRTGCDRVAVLGFCMGGMYALKAAATGRFDKAVSFYGMIRIPQAWRGAGQGEPLERLDQSGVCPVLAIVGGADHFTPPDDVDALRAIGGHVDVVVYPEAEHGFVHDPDRPTHRAGDAADAWGRAYAFLDAS